MKKGIDLSTYQRNLDYQALKDAGVEFAIIRSGYGKDSGQKDDMFEEHYAGCKAVGIKVGAYLYSYCTSIENAEKEAYNCLSHIEGKTFELPIFYDLEEQRTAILGTEAVTEIAKRFCKNAHANTPMQPPTINPVNKPIVKYLLLFILLYLP